MKISRLFYIAALTGSFGLSAQPTSTPLHEAVYRDDSAEVARLLRAKANANATNRYRVTPLSLACTNGNGVIVQALLKAGANPNTAIPGGETPLMTAARTGKPAPLKALLVAGANVHAKEIHGQTAIMWAAAEGNVAAVETLIEFGANFRERLDTGYTPLLFAVREGKIDVVRALLKAGADPNESIQTQKNVTRVLASGAGSPRAGMSALHLAVLNAHYELAAFLLDSGANPNAIGPGYAPLHIVSWVRKPGLGDNDPAPKGSGSMNSLEFVRKITAKGADPNIRMTKKINVGLTSLNTNGATPFMLAARSGDAELMRTLVKLGADPLMPNIDNSTPLMAAAGLGTRSPGEDAGTESEVLEAVELALSLGNDINAVDNNDETAMHAAAYKNLPRVVQYLASHGAKIEIWNRKNKFGWTPLTIAQGYRFGNFKPSAETVAAFLQVMSAAGVQPPSEKAEGISEYKKKPPPVTQR